MVLRDYLDGRRIFGRLFLIVLGVPVRGHVALCLLRGGSGLARHALPVRDRGN